MDKRILIKTILFLLISLGVFADETFITQDEYAAQLYKNPRGIGCDNCHGSNGEGKLVARYEHKGNKKEFRGSDLSTLVYADFSKGLSSRVGGMPRYFLTQSEIKALFHFVNSKKDKKRATK